MITTNYQSYGTSGFNLRLRVYQDGETRYVNVNKLLQGQLLKRHWNQKKQLFIASAPFSKENNEALVQIKRKYDEKALRNHRRKVTKKLRTMQNRLIKLVWRRKAY